MWDSAIDNFSQFLDLQESLQLDLPERIVQLLPSFLRWGMSYKRRLPLWVLEDVVTAPMEEAFPPCGGDVVLAAVLMFGFCNA